MRHRNCVQFYGLHKEGEQVSIIMEFLCEGSLDSFLRNHENQIPSNELNMMCIHIARGMSYLHSQNILHNDLAARNVLATLNDRKDDGKYLLKVSDFGLSTAAPSKYEIDDDRISTLPSLILFY